MNAELAGATLGLIGLGASGSELAKRAAAFDMRLVGLDARRAVRPACWPIST